MMVRRRSFRDILAASRAKRKREVIQADDDSYISSLKKALKSDFSSTKSRKRLRSSSVDSPSGKQTKGWHGSSDTKDGREETNEKPFRVPVGFAEDSQIEDDLDLTKDWSCAECGTKNLSWRLLCICCKKCKVFQRIEQKAKLEQDKNIDVKTSPTRTSKVEENFYGPFLPWQRPKKKNSQAPKASLPVNVTDLTKFKTAKELDAKLSGEMFESRIDIDGKEKIEDLKELGKKRLIQELKMWNLRTSGTIEELAARVLAVKKNKGVKGLPKDFFPKTASQPTARQKGTMAFLERAKAVREIDWMRKEQRNEK